MPGYTPRDWLLTYGVFGGLPGHLAMLDPSLGFAENVVSRVLDPTTRLFDEAQHMLDAFLGNAEVHYSILQAIAGGHETWSDITNRVGKSSGSLSRPMNWLIDMRLVRRVVPITEAHPARSKRALYRISDPYVRFWHRFVSSLIESGVSGQLGGEAIYRDRVEPRLGELMGPLFEQVCRTWIQSRHSPFPAVRVGEWWRQDAQVDVVAVSASGDVLMGECKWGTAGRSDLAALRTRAGPLLADLKTGGDVQFALFSGRGLADDDVSEEVARGRVQHFELGQLFK